MLSKNRNIDFIKVYACICVVGIHTVPRDNSIGMTAVYYLSGVAIPLFFMSSGFFLLNRGIVPARDAYRKITRILRLVLLWSMTLLMVGFIWDLICGKEMSYSIKSFAVEMVGGLLQRGKMWHFWYLGAMMLIYALLPYLSRFFQNRSSEMILLVCLILISASIQICSICLGYPVQKYVIQTFRIWTWLLYFVMGG